MTTERSRCLLQAVRYRLTFVENLLSVKNRTAQRVGPQGLYLMERVPPAVEAVLGHHHSLGAVPAFYLLPKFHKALHPVSHTFPGRQITDTTRNSLKKLDLYLEKLTNPILNEIPGSLKNTGALLRQLEAWIEGIDAATDFYCTKFQLLAELQARNGCLSPPPPMLFRQLLTTSNIFHFQEFWFFRQISGTGMGFSMSVFLANTFLSKRMAYL